MLKLKTANADALYSRISDSAKLYLPVKRAGQVNYDLWESGCEVTLGEMTVKSPKDLFFPQSEDLMAFRVSGKSIEIENPVLPTEPFVLFGVRACDARSFDVLDRVFLSDPVDSYYEARRNCGTVVSLGCMEPLRETCFCSVFGIDLAEPEGDVQAWVLGDEMYLNARTEKGEKLLSAVKDLCEETDGAPLAAAKDEARAKMAKNPLADLDLTGFDGEHMMEKFNAPEWKDLYQACLGCGTCTFVCPTCQCYDIRDFDTGHGIQRYRCWDSCMYSDFTMMAAGTNRKTQMERFRQRFMHKLVYFPANNEGMYSCVGCGRCVSKCPMHLHIAKVIRALGGKKQ